MHPPSAGEIWVDGKPVHFHSPRDATSVGIGTVYQDLALNPLMSVTRNFFMGREIYRGPPLVGPLDMRTRDEVTVREMARIGITIADPSQAVGTMSGGQRQTLAIARAIHFGARVLILDEPTSALGQVQQLEVLKTVKRVRAMGNIAIVFITHNELHARLIADRFTFLSLGEVIGGGVREDLSTAEIRRLMAGGQELAKLEETLS